MEGKKDARWIIVMDGGTARFTRRNAYSIVRINQERKGDEEKVMEPFAATVRF